MFRSLRISHVEMLLPDTEKLGPSAGMIGCNGISRLFRFSGISGKPREVHPKFRNEIPENFCSIRSPSKNFRRFWSNGKRPWSKGLSRRETLGTRVLRCIVDGKRLVRFESEKAVFKFLRRSGDWHPIRGGVEILLVTSYHRNQRWALAWWATWFVSGLLIIADEAKVRLLPARGWGSVVAWWLVRSPLDRTIRFRALTGDIAKTLRVALYLHPGEFNAGGSPAMD